MKFNNKVYDVLKWVCLICLPAVSVFYAVLDSVFGWGAVESVTTVISAVSVFIGSLIGISTAEYNKDGEQNG